MQTIKQGHTANLVHDDGTYRVWVSRMTTADGAPFDNAIEVEMLRDGRWVDLFTVDPASEEVHAPGGAPAFVDADLRDVLNGIIGEVVA